MSASKQSATEPARRRQPAAVTAAAAPPAVLARRLGNRNLQQLLQARLLQAKLTVNNPHDAFEQEADRVADQVMRMPEPAAHVSTQTSALVQRRCECAMELQRSEGPAAAAPHVDSTTEHAIASLSGRGQALPPAVRAFMEPRFNADFSAVRLHSDAHAQQLARSVSAQAFTVGSNIVFGAGHLAPETDHGRRLLAHELTHVLQQGAPQTLRRAPAQPPHQQFVPPESVIEMSEALDDAENLLVDPALLDRRPRLRLYGDAPLPKDWKPDERGAMLRIDAALDFVRPLVADSNIARYANDSLKATVMNAFYTTEWLQRAQRDFEEASRLRTLGVPVSTLAAKVSNILGRRAQAPLKVLAGEAVSFELEQGSSPRPAPEFRSKLRQQFKGGATLGKQELRVLAWLDTNKKAILDAETTYRIDRRAIAAAIAWEAMKNVMRGSPRSAGPGKMHTYSNAWSALLPFLPKGAAIPQQIEDLGLVPKPADDEAREATLRMPQGSITYIAAGMRAAADIALQSGYDISHELGALTSFYQGHDLPSWRTHMEKKKKRGEKAFVAADPMAVWTLANVSYLESVLGRPTP